MGKAVKNLPYELLTLSQARPWFLRVCSTHLLKTLREKDKLLVMSNFSVFHSVFYPFGEIRAIFIKFKIAICKLFWFGRVLKFVVWERINLHEDMKDFRE